MTYDIPIYYYASGKDVDVPDQRKTTGEGTVGCCVLVIGLLASTRAANICKVASYIVGYTIYSQSVSQSVMGLGLVLSHSLHGDGDGDGDEDRGEDASM